MTYQEEITLAEECGFKSEYDFRRGQPWCRFNDGNIHVWKVTPGNSNKEWACAVLIGNHYTDHTYHPTLKSALEYYD